MLVCKALIDFNEAIYSLNHPGLEIKRGTKLLGLMEVTFLVEDNVFGTK